MMTGDNKDKPSGKIIHLDGFRKKDASTIFRGVVQGVVFTVPSDSIVSVSQMHFMAVESYWLANQTLRDAGREKIEAGDRILFSLSKEAEPVPEFQYQRIIKLSFEP